MVRRYINGFDVDTDALAQGLRRLADGMEDGDKGVAVDQVSTQEHAHADDLVDFELSLSYVLTEAYVDVADMLSYAVDPYLRFEDEYVDPILNGDKRLTVRYDLERDFTTGETVTLIDEDGGVFAEATVECTATMTAHDAVERFGIGTYDTPEDLVERIRTLYGDEDIDEDSYVSAVMFDEVTATDAEGGR